MKLTSIMTGVSINSAVLVPETRDDQHDANGAEHETGCEDEGEIE